MDLSFLETQSYSTAPASGFAGVGEQHMSEAAIDGAPDGLMLSPFSCSPFIFRSRSLSLSRCVWVCGGYSDRDQSTFWCWVATTTSAAASSALVRLGVVPAVFA